MTPIQTYARVAGILFLLSFLGGSFGEFYVPSTLIVSGDPNATFNNIAAHEGLFRLGFVSYLVEGLCDAALSLVLYVILKPVNRNLSLLAAFFGLISTAHFAVCEMFFFGGPMLLKSPVYLQSFTKEQISALSYLFIRIYGYGAGLLMVFYGSASLVRGYLIYRSGFLPPLPRCSARAGRRRFHPQKSHARGGAGFSLRFSVDTGSDNDPGPDRVDAREGNRRAEVGSG